MENQSMSEIYPQKSSMDKMIEKSMKDMIHEALESGGNMTTQRA
jgi:hypothetical protein